MGELAMSDHFDARKDCPALRRATAAFIAELMADMLPAMRLAARGCGYALAEHGTMARDIDLIAIPWTAGAAEPDLLVARLCGVVAGFVGRAHPAGDWTEKPHGRRAKTIIHGAFGAEIDLSVMPIAEKEAR
jgi:hypothetical protein